MMTQGNRRSLSMHGKTLRMVTLSLLTALTILFSFMMIPLFGAFEVTLAVIPIIIGAVLLGPWASTFLGAVFGICSYVMCFGMSWFGGILLAENPIFAFLVCVPTRVLVGLLTGLTYRALTARKAASTVSIGSVSLLSSVSNTVLFLATLILLFGTEFLGANIGIEKATVFALIAALAGGNAIVEAIVCTVLGSGISGILLMLLRKNYGNDENN